MHSSTRPSTRDTGVRLSHETLDAMNTAPVPPLTATQVESAIDVQYATTVGSTLGPIEALGRGALVGRYLVLGHLGTGGMGTVYSAHDPELDRRIALKLVKSTGGGSEGRARLLREAQAMARLSHPNVVAVYDVGAVGDEVFIAMEFIHGTTLARWLAERPRTWREIVAVFLAAGRGLVAAHEADLVHRDLKPDNIMVGEDGRVRVMDFGLARSSDRAPATRDDAVGLGERLRSDLTRTGALVGTPAYMAPEQWEGGETSAKTDQFAYCVALWEAVYGERPFRGATIPVLMTAVIQGTWTAPENPRRAPAWLRAVLARGLECRPEDRWPSMAVLLAELGRERWAAARRWGAATLGVSALLAIAVGYQQIAEKRRAVEAERERAERAEASAVVAQERAARAAFERRVIEDAERSAEVLRLATMGAHERDALLQGVKVLAPFGPTFQDAPQAAVDGLARALPAMLPVATLPIPPLRSVNSIAFSEDGSLLAIDVSKPDENRIWSTSVQPDEGGIQLWDPVMRTKLREIPRPGGYAPPTLSVDGQLIAVSDRASCHVYRASTGEKIGELQECDEPRFAPDGARLYGKVPALSVRDAGQMAMPHRALRAWEIEPGTMLWTVDVKVYHSFSFEVHPDGDRLVIAGDDAAPTVLSAAAGRSGPSLSPNPAGWRGPGIPRTGGVIDVSPGGRYVAQSNATDDHGLVIVDLASMKAIALPVMSIYVQFLNDDRLLAWVYPDDLAVFVYDEERATWLRQRNDAPDGVVAETSAGAVILGEDRISLSLVGAPLHRQIAPLPVTEPLQTGFSASHYHDLFASTSSHSVMLWSASDPLEVERWSPPAGERVTGIHGQDLVTHDDAGTIRIHDRRSDRPPVVLPEPDPDDWLRRAWRVGHGIWREGDRLRYYDARSGVELYRHSDPGAGGWSTLAPARAAALLAAATLDGSVEVIDPVTGGRQCTIPGDGSHVQEVRISDDGMWVALVRTSGRVEVWSADTCERSIAPDVLDAFDVATLRRSVRDFKFTADGALLLGSATRTLLLDPETGVERLRVEAYCRIVSSTDRYLLSACGGDSEERGAWIRDNESGQKITRLDLSGYGGPIAFSPSDDLVAARTANGQIAIIDVLSGEESFRLYTRTPVTEFHLREDGPYIDALDEISGVVHTYPTTRRGLYAAACRALARTDVAREVESLCADPEGPPT